MNSKVFFIFFLFMFPAIVLAGRININTATSEELDKITGIGPVTAQKIIDARPFLSIDDLIKVSGIGEKTLQKIKDQGLACVNCETNVEEARPPENLHADSVEVGPPISYPGGVIINEILPSPQGADETNEWIELYNSNDFEIDLSGWKIKDTTGTTATFIIPKYLPAGRQAKISAKGFLVFKRPDTKIVLNNDEDGLMLSTPDGKIADSITYASAPQNQSYNKTALAWAWSASLTPGDVNVVTGIVKSLSKSKNSVKNNNIKAELADISLPAQADQFLNINQTANPWFLFFTALIITMISAAAVLFIKIKFKHVRT